MNIADLRLPYNDLRSKVNTYIKNKWQTAWDTFPENELHTVQSTVCMMNNPILARRRDDIVMERSPIGHTYLEVR